MKAAARPYKEETPLRTIARIRSILADQEIMPIEETWFHPYPHTYSVRLVTGGEFGHFGANGKGLDPRHCLASAYAEFLERLQNNTHLFDTSRRNLIGLGDEFGFCFYPDERLMSQAEFTALPQPIIHDLLPARDYGTDDAIGRYFSALQAGGRQGCLAAPFDLLAAHGGVAPGQRMFLPYDQLVHATGSNGMAAGNTRDEALVAGLFEVMERWAAAEVFFKRLTPPTITLACLDGLDEQQEIVSRLRADGYEVIIKDFSAGLGLPVIGVLAVDRRAAKYRLAVGSDSSFPVAVARCLTEAYQGVANRDDFSTTLNALPQAEDADAAAWDHMSAAEVEHEFSRFTKNYRGRFPKTLFDSQASYDVDLTPFAPQPTYAQELLTWVGHLQALGKQVLVRDVSWLGFPSYHIYVPGVSAQFHEARALADGFDPQLRQRLEQAVDWFCAPRPLAADQWAHIAAVFDSLPADTRFARALQLEFDADSELASTPVSYFAAAIWYGLRRCEDALQAVDRYLAAIAQEPQSNAQLDYYLAIRSWIAGKGQGQADGSVEESLRRQGFGAALIDTVRADMADPQMSLRDLPAPRCPHCHLCALRPSCISGGKLDLARRVYPAYAAAGAPGASD